MLVTVLCVIAGAMFLRWIQEEDFMKSFGAIVGAFAGLCIGLFLSVAIGLAVVPTTTTKIKEYNISKYYIDNNTLYYEGEDGAMGSIDMDSKDIKTGNKTYIKKRYYKVNKNMNFIVFCVGGVEETIYLKGAD